MRSTAPDSPQSMRSTASDSPHSMRINVPDSPHSMRSNVSVSSHSMRSIAPDSLDSIMRIPNTHNINTNQSKPQIEQMDNKIKVLYTNVDQLPNKIHE